MVGVVFFILVFTIGVCRYVPVEILSCTYVIPPK